MTSNQHPDHEQWLAETWQMIAKCAVSLSPMDRVTLSPAGCAALLAERHADETKAPLTPGGEEIRAALNLIAERSCENFTGGPGSCWRAPGRTPEARYTAERWCDPCIALAAIVPPQAGV